MDTIGVIFVVGISTLVMAWCFFYAYPHYKTETGIQFQAENTLMNGCKLTAIIAAGVGGGIIIAFLVLAYLAYLGSTSSQQYYVYPTPIPACGTGHVAYYNGTPYCAYP